MDRRVSIGRVKREISDLVNRVAYGGERIVLTSRGRPKAVLVSMEDYERLKGLDRRDRLAHLQAWAEASNALAEAIVARRGGQPIDVDRLMEAARQDLEARGE